MITTSLRAFNNLWPHMIYINIESFSFTESVFCDESQLNHKKLTKIQMMKLIPSFNHPLTKVAVTATVHQG